MKQLANIRRARAGETLTRWVKEPGRHAKPSKTAPMPLTATGTRFKSRVIKPEDMGSVLVSGHSNIKIGRDVRKGKLKGYHIYTLSLEERATCPSSCQHWTTCYGNAMPFAKRVAHTPDMMLRIAGEIEKLLAVRGRKGLLIRLHALGDFYSVDYVLFWDAMLSIHPNLAIFGYTARSMLHDPIGLELGRMTLVWGDRFAVRASNAQWPELSTVNIDKIEDCPSNAFVCPEQTGKTLACATCGACWGTKKNVAFLNH